MKKLLAASLIVLSMPLFGLVWEEDPSITPQERQARKEQNARLKKYYSKYDTGLKKSADPLTWGPSTIKDQEKTRERLDETDGSVQQMEQSATDADDVNFDDED